MIKVNLLEEQRRKIVKRDSKVAAVNKTAYGLLALVVLLFLGFQGVRLWYLFQKNQVETNLTDQKRKLVTFGQIEAEGIVVADKLNEIAKIIDGRDSTREKLRLVFDIFDNGSSLKQIGFGGVTDSGGLQVSGTADGVFAYIDFDQRIKELSEREGFEKLSLSSLARGDDKKYSFNYEIVVSAKKANEPKGAGNAK